MKSILIAAILASTTASANDLSNWDGVPPPPAPATSRLEASCRGGVQLTGFASDRLSGGEPTPVYGGAPITISVAKRADGSLSAGVTRGGAYETRKVSLVRKDRRKVTFEGQGLKLTVFVNSPEG